MSAQELATRPNGAVELAQPDFTAEQVQLLKDTVCKGATNAELALFQQVCRSKRLDPFSKQIHAVKRPVQENGQWREVMSFQTGIDGFRLIAERSGQYRGQTDPVWCGVDGVWKDIWLDNKPPFTAKVGVYRAGFVQPLTRVARWSEYCQRKKDGDPVKMWASMPTGQLAKCAEALALRAAFPEELSGLYTREEMGQAESEEPTFAEKAQAAQDAGLKKLAQLKAMKELPAAAEVHDAEFVDNEPPPPPPDDKPEAGKFEILEHFGNIKKEFAKLGAQSRYYGVLGKFNYKKSNEVKQSEAKKVYAHMAAELKALKLEIADREETQKLYASLVLTYGEDAVTAEIAREGSASWEEVPAAERDAVLDKIGKTLRAA